MQIASQCVSLVTHTPDLLEHIEKMGRVCYQSDPKGEPEAFVRKLIKSGHESVLEHGSMTFMIVCSRGISHELVRHRIGVSFSQESSRYCSYNKRQFGSEITVIQPPGLSIENRNYWKQACLSAEAAYMEMLDAGASTQIAREVLPTCLKTQLAISFNARSIRHSLKQRTSLKAHPQMQEIARAMHCLIQTKWPVLVEDIILPVQPLSAKE